MMSNGKDNHEGDPSVVSNGKDMRQSGKTAIINACLKHTNKYYHQFYYNSIIYLIVVIIIGLPLWWITTSPHRASLQRVTTSKIEFPVQIQFFTLADSGGDIRKITELVKDSEILKVPYDEENTFNIQFIPEYTHKHVNEDEIVKISKTVLNESQNITTCNIIIASDELFSKLSSKSACPTYITPSGALLIRASSDNTDNVHYIQEFINNHWMDVPKITNFMNRASNIDTEHLTSDVWNEVPISGAYNTHLVFIHDNLKDNEWTIDVEDDIRREINKIVGYLSDTAHFKITEEHFWDLFDMDILKKDDKGSYKGTLADYNSFITEVDQLSSPFVSSHPLLKFVVLLTENGVVIDDKKMKGLTYLSWGTLINANPKFKKDQRDAIHESFQTLLGAAQGSPSDVKFCCSRALPSQFIWDRFRRRSFFENSIRSKIFINAVSSLASTIQQLVITDEVGEMITKSNKLLAEGIEEQNPQKIAAARLLAEKAAKHETLLGMVDLTLFFKFWVYFPIVMGFMLPISRDIISWVFYKLFSLFRKTKND